MAEKSGLNVTKTDAEKRVEAQQKVLEKSIAEQDKQTAGLTEAQKGLSKRFQTLTSKLGNSDMSLATTAANLRQGTKETFSGLLASRNLAKKLEEVEKDPAFAAAKVLVVQRNNDLAMANKVQDNNLNEQQTALEEAREKNKELKALHTEIIKIEAQRKKSESSGRDASGKFTTELEANLKAQEETAATNQKIDAKELSIKSIYTKKIEDQTLVIEKANNKVDLALTEEGKIRDGLADELRDSTTSEGFDNFNDGLKGLTGGVVDIGGAFDSVVKFATNLIAVISGVSLFFKTFPTSMTGMMDKVKAKFSTKGAEASTEMVGPVQQRLKKDGTKDKRFKANKAPPEIGIMGKIGGGLKGIGNSYMNAFKLMGKGLDGLATNMLKIGKGLIKAVARLAIGAGMMLIGLLGTALGLMIGALPFIAIALAIGLAIGLFVGAIKALMERFPIIGETLTAIKDWIMEKVQVLWDFISTLDFSAVTEMFSAMWTAIKDVFSGLVDFFSAAFRGDFDGMFEAVKKIFSAIIDYIKAPFVAIGKFFSDNSEEDPVLSAAKDSGLYEKRGFGLTGNTDSVVDMDKAKTASTTQLESILADGDMSDEQTSQIQAMVDQRKALLEIKPTEPTKGQELAEGTTEVQQGDKKGGGNSSNSTVVTADNSSNVSQMTSVTTVSPRDRDGTVGRLNLAVG